MDAGEKLLTAKINDLFNMCDRRCIPQFSAFLDGGEQAALEDNFRIPVGYNVLSFGGYERAERKIFGVFPQWTEADTSEFPISLLRIDAPPFRSLTHRDYLGTLMSLGIDRSKTGDILTDEEGAYVFVMSDVAEYIARSVNKIANIGVKSKIVPELSQASLKVSTELEECVCASLRIDAVAAAAYNISRASAEKLIHAGHVKLNHREITDRSKQVSEGDLLSVRGFGRCILAGAGTQTRSGRLHITIEKFI